MSSDIPGSRTKAQVSWQATGEPRVTGTPAPVNVSVSHTESTLVSVAGAGDQGIDLEEVQARSREGWLDLLGARREALLDDLVGAGDGLDLAGTRIWAAVEAAWKATHAKDEMLSFVAKKAEAVLLRFEAPRGAVQVLTFPVRAPGAPERVMAVVSRSPEGQRPHERRASFGAKMLAAVESTHLTPGLSNAEVAALLKRCLDPRMFGIDSTTEGPEQRCVYTQRFPLSFKESQALSRTVYFSNYYTWMGLIRECATLPVLEAIGQTIVEGRHGLVTNWSKVDIVGEAGANDVIEVRFWNERVLGSTIDFYYEWVKVQPEGPAERLAVGEMSATWVQILGHGQVKTQPIPPILEKWIRLMLPRGEPTVRFGPAPESLAQVSAGPERWKKAPGPLPGPHLRTDVFQTTLEDANIVGNVYFANYGKWQGRVRDLYLQQLAPDLFRGNGSTGEWVVRTTRVDHLREAMPFDRIKVVMSLEALHERGVALRFDYSRLDADGTELKLAVGQQLAVWVERPQGAPVAATMPTAFASALETAASRG